MRFYSFRRDKKFYHFFSVPDKKHYQIKRETIKDHQQVRKEIIEAIKEVRWELITSGSFITPTQEEMQRLINKVHF